MEYSAHVDTWVRDHLPPPDQRPEHVFDLPELQFPERLNCAVLIVDRHIAEGRGEHPCVLGPLGTVTYGDLVRRSNRIAHVLVDDLAVVPGNRVLLLGHNGVTLLAAWYAVVKAGGIAVTLPPSLRPREIAQVLQRAQVDVALADQRLAPQLLEAASGRPEFRGVFWGEQGDLDRRTATKSEAFPVVDTAADDPCVIAFTSGSTGTPKAAVHTHRSVISTCAIFADAPLGPGPTDVFVGTPPLAFTFGLMALGCYPLYLGATVVMVERTGAEELAAAIEQYQATICFSAPTVYRKWLRQQVDPSRLASLRVVVSSAEPLAAYDWLAFRERYGLQIVNVMGSTEMLHAFMSTGVAPPRPGSLGKPIRGYRAAVVDEDGEPLPAGSVGLLAVKGPTGCMYLDDPRQAERVRRGWTLTGDRAREDDAGYFWFEGRLDDLVLSAGYTIAPAEVEAVLLEHPGVTECLVVPTPDPVKGSVLKATVVATAALRGDPEAATTLRTHVLGRLAPYKCPAVVEFADDLPRTATGKVKRRRQPST